MTEPLLRIRDLRVRLPDGRALFDGLDLTLEQGEVVALLGGSGAGKSTLARVLFERDDLIDAGFEVAPPDAIELGKGASLGLVPQRGAAFDHLDVAGNIALALRRRVEGSGDSERAGPDSVASWLAAVDLPAEMGASGTEVSRLSGGQAQRLAVARTLASGRRVLFLDEPSVGLDPLRVKGLAELVRQTASQRGAAVLVVTHDLSFAQQVADRLLFLDPARGKLVPLGAEEPQVLEADVLDKLEAGEAATRAADDERRAPPRRLASLGRRALGSLLMPAAALLALPRALRHAGDTLRVLLRVLRASLLRPLPFYLIVSVLLGYTVLYVISRALPVGLRAAKAVELVGGSYILALAPPVCAFLFVATSGSATSAWLGSMGLTRQIAALEALGISRRDYLWVPCYFGLLVAFVLVAATFAGGMALGGYWHCVQSGVADPWPLLLGDLLDPEPNRAVLRSRALWLCGIYACGVAAEVVFRSTLRKDSADDVTRAMTGSVVIATLWVVALELVTAMWVFRR
ncbi:MAG: ATP-binding cassette domain-containing protein [Myxococcales bacterium]|nr:ATP-binding cassette domain-containing protein [Myxococcales bacterium]